MIPLLPHRHGRIESKPAGALFFFNPNFALTFGKNGLCPATL